MGVIGVSLSHNVHYIQTDDIHENTQVKILILSGVNQSLPTYFFLFVILSTLASIYLHQGLKSVIAQELTLRDNHYN